MNDVYQKLAKHLDNLPGGFPETDSGVELRILKRLFTTQEAEIAMGLSMAAEPAAAIAPRMNLDESHMAQILESMSRKASANKYLESLSANMPNFDIPAPTTATPLPSFLCPRISPHV